MNYIKALLRIYLSNGLLIYNDESINESVSIKFKQRPKFQTIFICLFFVSLATFSQLKIEFEVTAKLMTILYLAGDLFFLARSVKFQETIPSQNYYSEYSTKERIQSSLVGGLNLMFFFMLFME